MKFRIFFYLVALIIFMSCNQQKKTNEIPADVVQNPITASGKNNTDNLPYFKFVEETHDFGKVIQGEKVMFSFKFTNTGKSDLLIASATASCGCTVPEYPKKPIHPNEEGIIKVSFNTDGKKGVQNKTITIMANTQPNTKVLTIKADVYTPESK
jgi:hypothetical protein